MSPSKFSIPRVSAAPATWRAGGLRRVGGGNALDRREGAGTESLCDRPEPAAPKVVTTLQSPDGGRQNSCRVSPRPTHSLIQEHAENATVHCPTACPDCEYPAPALPPVTTMLVERFDGIAIADWNVAGMLKYHKLARVIADRGVGAFRRQLEYQASRRGATVVVANRGYPSRKPCSACGYKVPKSAALRTGVDGSRRSYGSCPRHPCGHPFTPSGREFDGGSLILPGGRTARRPSFREEVVIA